MKPPTFPSLFYALFCISILILSCIVDKHQNNKPSYYLNLYDDKATIIDPDNNRIVHTFDSTTALYLLLLKDNE